MSFHNARNTLGDAIRSLIWQTYSNWELVLLDDGSTDDSAATAEAFNDARIRLFRDLRRKGLPYRLNQGIALARGQYIARMDADDIAFPERFIRQIHYLRNHPETDLLATSCLLLNAMGNPIGILPAGVSHEAICLHPWNGFPMPHPTWMGRKEWFLQHKYDERASKGQDQALLYRTFRNSRFAGLQDVLMAYSYPNLSVKKTVIGRYYYLRAVYAEGDTEDILRGTAGHILAILRDLGAITTAGEWVVKRRLQPLNPVSISQWQELRLRLDCLRENAAWK